MRPLLKREKVMTSDITNKEGWRSCCCSQPTATVCIQGI